MLKLTQLAGFGGKAQRPASFTYLGSQEDTNNLSSYTFSGMPFGVNRAPRQVVVAISTRSGSGSVTITGVTVGGVAATQVIKADGGSGVTNIAALWRAENVPGETGDVVVTTSATMTAMGISTYALYDYKRGTATDTGGTVNDATAININPLTVSTAQAGAVIAVGFNNANTTCTWTGIDEDYDSQIGAEALMMTSAHRNFSSLPAAFDVTADYASGTSLATCAAYFY